MATERPKIRREEPPPQKRAGRPRTTPVWALAAEAKARPGVWVVMEVARDQNATGGMVFACRRGLRDKRYEFATRKKGDRVTAVYCRFNAGGKS